MRSGCINLLFGDKYVWKLKKKIVKIPCHASGERLSSCSDYLIYIWLSINIFLSLPSLKQLCHSIYQRKVIVIKGFLGVQWIILSHAALQHCQSVCFDCQSVLVTSKITTSKLAVLTFQEFSPTKILYSFPRKINYYRKLAISI